MWIYVPGPSTISASAPEAADSISASSWQCQALARSVWWRGKPSPLLIWSRRCKHHSWLRRLCGAMSEPSQADHGVASWMASLAEFRVSHIVSPESASGKTTSATSGAMQDGSSSSAEPGSSSSKTSRGCSRPAAPSASSETFADLVLRLRSDYSARQKRAQAISATVSSSSQWPTARVWDSEGGPDLNQSERPNTDAPSLLTMAKLWPTPSVRDEKGANGPEHLQNGTGRLHLDQLPNFVEFLWSTPRSSDGEKGGPNQSFGAGGIPLPAQASQWMAPRVSEDGQYQYNKGNKDDPVLTLQGQAQAWSTPSVVDTTGGRMTRSGDRSGEPLLKGQAETASLRSSLPDHPISTAGEESSKIRRTLNPLFVEWLMGWPPGWTSLALTPPASNACACSATALYLYRQRMQSALSGLGLPPTARPAQLSLFS